MKTNNTFFGSLTEIKSDGDSGDVIAELAFFHAKGKPHHHDKWEHCYVTDGCGEIIVVYAYGEKKYSVIKGDKLSIPPLCDHWMIPDTTLCMEILLVYSNT